MMPKKILKAALLSLFVGAMFWFFSEAPVALAVAPKSSSANPWVKETLATLSLREKVAQLFIVEASTENIAQVSKAIELGAGGVYWTDHTPIGEKLHIMHKNWQEASKVPLLIGASSMASCLPSIQPLTLGAVENTELVEDWGRLVGLKGKSLGFHFLALPSLAIATNRLNPIEGDRTLGSIPSKVAAVAVAYASGLNKARLLPLADGFPGCGDLLPVDPLPVLDQGRARLDSVEMYPYRSLISSGLSCIQMGQAAVRTLTDTLPLSFAAEAVGNLLEEGLSYQGMLFSQPLDDLQESTGLSDEELYLNPLKAGVDLLLSPPNLEKGVEVLLRAVQSGSISEEEIDEKLEKLLVAKKAPATSNAAGDGNLGSNTSLQLQLEITRKRIYEESVVLLRYDAADFPLINLPQKVGVINCYSKGAKVFSMKDMVTRYAGAREFHLLADAAEEERWSKARRFGRSNDLIILSVYGDIGQEAGVELSSLIKGLQESGKLLTVLHGNPRFLPSLMASKTLFWVNEQDSLMSSVVPQSLFGALPLSGELPIHASYSLTAGASSKLPSLQRLGYAAPEAVGVNGSQLHAKVDALMQRAIQREATPGGQIVFVKNGKVIFQKAYGCQTYSKKMPITDSTVYDLASLTKVLSTLQAAMKLEGEGEFNLEARVDAYIEKAKGTNKGGLKWKDILTHQAGLQAFLPHYNEVKKLGSLTSKIRSEDYSIPIARDIYGHKSLKDSVKQWTLASSLRPGSSPYSYKYSDVGFYLLMWMIEEQTGMALDEYMNEHFYRPMGLKTLGYLPRERFSKEQLPPTEFDRHYRMQLIRGYVHDPGAALLGGVCGHAGLFGNALDVARMMQMNLQDGYYGGKQYIPKETIDRFNTQPFAKTRKNRRAIGWDKSVLTGHGGSTSPYAPHEMFGHTGFTGTAAWADPENQMVYVFLSNRVYPYAGNWKLIREDYREDIMTAFYEAAGIEQKREDFKGD